MGHKYFERKPRKVPARRTTVSYRNGRRSSYTARQRSPKRRTYSGGDLFTGINRFFKNWFGRKKRH